MTEPDIVAACRQGDRRAQHELYARTCDRVYRLLLRMTHNADDADELTQEVYIRVFGHIDRFEGTSAVATWIYRIALNEARQFLRRQRRRPEEGSPGDLAEEAGPAAPDHDLRLDVEAALARLPDDDRELVVLRYFQRLSYAEMAEVLEKPAGTIASGLNRARRTLRSLLDADSGRAAEEDEAPRHLTG